MEEKKIDVKALFNISYGMYVVGSASGSRLNAQVANTVFQATGEPITVAACLNKENLTTEFVKESGFFSVSILDSQTPLPFIGRFGFKSGRDIDKFEGVQYKLGPSGMPLLLEHTLAVIEARVVSTFDVGTHLLFLGEVEFSEVIAQGQPLTYADYHLLKKGRSPKTSPTFVLNEVKD